MIKTQVGLWTLVLGITKNTLVTKFCLLLEDWECGGCQMYWAKIQVIFTSYSVLRERKEALIDLDIDRLIPVVYLSSHRNREVELGDCLNIPPLISLSIKNNERNEETIHEHIRVKLWLVKQIKNKIDIMISNQNL